MDIPYHNTLKYFTAEEAKPSLSPSPSPSPPPSAPPTADASATFLTWSKGFRWLAIVGRAFPLPFVSWYNSRGRFGGGPMSVPGGVVEGAGFGTAAGGGFLIEGGLNGLKTIAGDGLQSRS